MKFRYLEYAVMIKNCRSISKAAERLYISQPALSEAVNLMEEKLGFTVFKRTNKGVEITTLGQQFLQDAEEILQIGNRWKDYAKQQESQEIRGEVGIALTPSFCDMFIATVFDKLRNAYPNLAIVLHQMPSEDICHFLLRENLSLGIFSIEQERVPEFLNAFSKSGFSSTFLYQDSFMLFVSADDPLASKKKITLKDLWSYTLVMLEEKRNSVTNSEFSRYFHKKHIVPKTDNLLQILLQPGSVAIFVSHGLQNSYFVKQGFIQMRPFQESDQVIEYYLVYRQKKFLSAEERAVMRDIILEYV